MTRPKQNNLIKFFLFLVIVLACWAYGKNFSHLKPEDFQVYLQQFPIYISGPVYVVMYVVLTFFIWLSKDAMMISGAWVYGLIGSTVLICIAETVNAVVLFQMARRLGRGFVESRMQGKFSRLDERLAGATFWDMFFLRAVILVPHRFLDMGFGLTNVDFKRYMTAVVLGSPPRILMRQYFIIVVLSLMDQGISAVINYAQANPWINAVNFIYIAAVIILFVRLKKLVFG